MKPAHAGGLYVKCHMEERVYGNVQDEGLEVVKRDERFFVRYDAGAHQMIWREDELTVEEFNRLTQGKAQEHSVLLELQRRLGFDAYVQNWRPPEA
jgi:hypothetical protein